MRHRHCYGVQYRLGTLATIYIFIFYLVYFVLYRKCSISACTSIVAASSNWFRYSLVSMSVDIARDLAGVHPLAALSSNSSHPGTRWQRSAKWHQYTGKRMNTWRKHYWVQSEKMLRVTEVNNTRLPMHPGLTNIYSVRSIFFSESFTDQAVECNDLSKNAKALDQGCTTWKNHVQNTTKSNLCETRVPLQGL